MILKNKEGVKVHVSLEVVRERINGIVTWSDLKEPTKRQIKKITKKPCNHKKQKKLLVFDQEGYPYDFRICFVCGEHLGLI